MPKKLIIVRHGETDHNVNKIIQGHLDIDLNARGKDQARLVAEKLKDEPIQVIFSSDLKRAAQTAQEIAEKLKLPVIKTPLLRERSFGKLQGVSFLEISRYFPQYDKMSQFSFSEADFIHSPNEHNVETDESIMRRLSEFKALLKAHKGKTILIVTHGGLIRMLFRYLLGFSIAEVSSMHVHNTQSIVIEESNGKYLLKK